MIWYFIKVIADTYQERQSSCTQDQVGVFVFVVLVLLVDKVPVVFALVLAHRGDPLSAGGVLQGRHRCADGQRIDSRNRRSDRRGERDGDSGVSVAAGG